MTNIDTRRISEDIVDLILSEPNLDKAKLVGSISVLIRLWLKIPKVTKMERKKNKLQTVYLKNEAEALYWKQRTKELVSKEELAVMYKEIDDICKIRGFKKQHNK